MDVEAELAAVRRRAAEQADLWAKWHARRQWLDGRADRAAMGNPDPTFADYMRAIGRAAEAFIKAVGKATGINP